MSRVYLTAAYLVAVLLALVALLRFSIAGDGWRAFGVSLVLVVLVVLRRDLTEEAR